MKNYTLALKDRQTMFDIVLKTNGSLDALVDVVNNNDDIFANQINVSDRIENKPVIDYFKFKDIITY